MTLVMLARYPRVTLRVTLLRTMEGRRQHRSLMSGPSIGPGGTGQQVRDGLDNVRKDHDEHPRPSPIGRHRRAGRTPPTADGGHALDHPRGGEVPPDRRSAAYELARRFEATGGAEGLPCVRIGDRLLRVPVDALREMVTIRA